jgi:hypothetical protein
MQLTRVRILRNTMRPLLAVLVLLLACRRPTQTPIQNAAPRSGVDPLAKLRVFEATMCACLVNQGPEIDESCSGTAAEPVNAWIHDGTSWKRGLTNDQVTEANEILDRIQRCFQAGIGDPLPPRRGQ